MRTSRHRPHSGANSVTGCQLVTEVKDFKVQILFSCRLFCHVYLDGPRETAQNREPVRFQGAREQACMCPLVLTSSLSPSRVRGEIMPSSGHRLRDVEHHPLLTENDSYDSSSSSSSEADVADRVWFIRDGCGMICAVMTWLLVVYADFVVTFVMLLPSKDFWYSVVNGVLFNCLAVLALASHLRTMLTDPVSTRCHPALPSCLLVWPHRPCGLRLLFPG